MKPRNRFDYSDHWPTCYPSQAAAGIEEGPLEWRHDDDRSADHLDWFALGFGIGLLFGLALIDWVGA